MSLEWVIHSPLFHRSPLVVVWAFAREKVLYVVRSLVLSTVFALYCPLCCMLFCVPYSPPYTKCRLLLLTPYFCTLLEVKQFGIVFIRAVIFWNIYIVCFLHVCHHKFLHFEMQRINTYLLDIHQVWVNSEDVLHSEIATSSHLQNNSLFNKVS